MSDLPLLTIDNLKALYASGCSTPEKLFLELAKAIEASVDDHLWTRPLSFEEMKVFLDRADPEAPLYGVPFAIKDNIHLEGFPTTAACKEFEQVPEKSATVVRALIDAGAIPVGKANMDQFATGLVGTRSPYGVCRHAWHGESISGGSSSGSAVAVARNLCTFSLGTDTAGSGRVPAALNGIFGYKPTPGLLSMTGVVPACRSLDTVSVFAHGSEDLQTLLPIVSEKDPSDPLQVVEPQPGRRGRPRMAIMPASDLQFFGRGDYAQRYEEGVLSLKRQGYQLDEVDLETFSQVALMLYEGPWVAERYSAVGAFLKDDPPSADPTVKKIILGGENIPAAKAFAALTQLAGRKKLALEVFDRYDGVLLPTIGGWFTRDDIAADPIGANSSLGLYTNFANLLGLSACAFPVGAAPKEGEPPFGFTLFAPGGQDADVLEWISDLRDALHWQPMVVCGAHLEGFPLNHQLTEPGGVLEGVCRSAPHYRMVALNEMKPGMILQAGGGESLEVEVWKLPRRAWGAFVEGIPSPLGIGKVHLDDGRTLPGFICESAGAQGAEDITSFGGWRAFKSKPQ